ncbi:MAG TPA: DUF4138 domain-containing protein [Sphingobacteriaceae bacterium]
MKNIIGVVCILLLSVGQYALGQQVEVSAVPGKTLLDELVDGNGEGFRGGEKIRFRPVSRDRRGKVRMVMGRPLVAADQIYLRLMFRNRSAISYDVDFFRFFVRDRKIARRTITQEQELRPVQFFVPERKVPAGKKAYCLFVMDKFTLAHEKVLRCEVFENGGGRHFQLQIKAAKLAKAQQFKRGSG